MKAINEIYSLLYDDIKDSYRITSICARIDRLFYGAKINETEYNNIKQHFQENKPNENQHQEFLNNNWNNGEEFRWWNEDTEVRKEFIKKMVNITK